MRATSAARATNRLELRNRSTAVDVDAVASFVPRGTTFHAFITPVLNQARQSGLTAVLVHVPQHVDLEPARAFGRAVLDSGRPFADSALERRVLAFDLIKRRLDPVSGQTSADYAKAALSRFGEDLKAQAAAGTSLSVSHDVLSTSAKYLQREASVAGLAFSASESRWPGFSRVTLRAAERP